MPDEEVVELRLSASQISTFDQCPLKWKYRYVDKIYGEATPAMITGTFVHAVFEAMYALDKSERTLDAAKAIARTEWDKLVDTEDFKRFDLDEITQKEFRVNSWKLIRRLWELEHPDKINVVDVEMEIYFKVTEGVYLIGFIDRLDEGKLGVDVVDYKTGKRPMKRYEGDKVKQIALYALGISKLTDHTLGKGKLLFLGGDDPGIISRNVTQELLEETEKKLLADAEAILTAKKDPSNAKPKTGPLCGWCDYIQLCPTGQKYVQGRMSQGSMRADAPAVLFLKELAKDPSQPRASEEDF